MEGDSSSFLFPLPLSPSPTLSCPTCELKIREKGDFLSSAQLTVHPFHALVSHFEVRETEGNVRTKRDRQKLPHFPPFIFIFLPQTHTDTLLIPHFYQFSLFSLHLHPSLHFLILISQNRKEKWGEKRTERDLLWNFHKIEHSIGFAYW